VNETLISIGEVAENLRGIVERARSESVSFVMTDNGVPVARIIPEVKKSCSGRELAAMLETIKHTAVDFEQWRNDLESGKAALLPPRDKWA
jgi:antitoxin (DNA-binding transcriptional repressor) of toxin-antitoxin stability system